MQANRLGRSSVYVTELSFGAAGIGNLYTPVSDTTASASVRAAWEAGHQGELVLGSGLYTFSGRGESPHRR